VDVKYKEQLWLYSTHSRLSVDDINNWRIGCQVY
jgi:hypothetical protein